MPSPFLEAVWKPKHNPWLIALTVTLATFMEVLDTSIANVALPHIAGSVGASQEEATWVLTSYLVSSAVIVPISGWLSSTLNYVGVPREKSNQISALSNFARNMGGSAGTALLTTFLARSAQINQTSLAANIVPGSYAVSDFIARLAQQMHTTVAAARPAALAQIYGQMQLQASMLAYKNAFALLAGVLLVLSPLVWIMRLPAKRAPIDPEQMAAH